MTDAVPVRPEPGDPVQVRLALLSHTNVGKTTLARTLLRRDVGEVEDRAHVTQLAEQHRIIASDAGDELLLWDTPGFGDSVRLWRRLEASGRPIGWFLSQLWDRFADRAFWCSQQAMRAARDSADVLLYVANATESPTDSGYAAAELRILRWLDKPTLVLLNQLGTRVDVERDAATAREWRELADRECPGLVAGVLPFDAFARCWLQEHLLLARIGECLDDEVRVGYGRLHLACVQRDTQVLGESASIIARQIRAMALEVVDVPAETLAAKLRGLWRRLASDETTAANAAEEKAQRAMLQRLDATVRESTAALVRLHGLSGEASDEILAQLGREFATERATDPDRVGVWSGVVSGALGGLAADLAAGGLTLGAGALVGGITGALGARKLTQVYNAGRGLDGSVVRWSDEFLAARLEAALVRYLAVAHYGRGRGEFRASDPDPRWPQVVREALLARESSIASHWSRLRAAGEEAVVLEFAREIESVLYEVLARLYPEAAAFFTSPPGRGRRESAG